MFCVGTQIFAKPPRVGAGAALAAGEGPRHHRGSGSRHRRGSAGWGEPGITGRAVPVSPGERSAGAAPASPCAGGVFGLGNQVEDDVLVAPEGGDVQGAPAVAVGQADVGAELDQELDELEVAVDDGLVQSRLPLGPEGVDVELAVRHVLQQRLQLLGVAPGGVWLQS